MVTHYICSMGAKRQEMPNPVISLCPHLYLNIFYNYCYEIFPKAFILWKDHFQKLNTEDMIHSWGWTDASNILELAHESEYLCRFMQG